MLSIIAPKDMPYILMGIVVNMFLCTITPPLVVIQQRLSTFNLEYLSNFAVEHEDNFPGTYIPAGGIPDHGSGWYSKKLDYRNWFQFNVRHRIHMNFVESLPVNFMFSFLCAFYYPKIALLGTWGLVAGRIIYTIGYFITPESRGWGGFLMFVCSLTMMVSTIVGVSNAINDY